MDYLKGNHDICPHCKKVIDINEYDWDTDFEFAKEQKLENVACHHCGGKIRIEEQILYWIEPLEESNE